ncbi:hypothetical protein TNCV_1744651 [Trichonephila clavipes]|nr:hypothetical protein TNCV_1744651 [Trichonephila clavipes]
MFTVIQLTLSPDGSKSMTETLPCSVGLHNQQISIQLKSRGSNQMEHLETGFSTIQYEGIEKCNSSDMISNSAYHPLTTH